MEYSIKDEIYVPDENNFLKTSYLKKIDIIKNDDLSRLIENIQIETNSSGDIEPIRIESKNLKKLEKINNDSNDKKNFKELYLKYKNKYLRLKNNK